MNILTINDNPAVRAAMADVLTSAGNAVTSAEDPKEAAKMASEPRFDVVILDADLRSGTGLSILDSIRVQDRPPRILVVKGPGTSVPTDTVFVKGSIDKPFSSADLLSAVEDIADTADDSRPKAKEKERRGLFRKKVQEDVRTPAEAGLEFGKSYVLFQKEPKAVYAAAAVLASAGDDIIVISSSRPKAVKEKFRGRNIETVTVEAKAKDEFYGVFRMGTLVNRIKEFLTRAERPVVVFDDLNLLIDMNGMNSALVMISEVTAMKPGKPFTVMASVDAEGFCEKDRSILKNQLNYYIPSDGRDTR